MNDRSFITEKQTKEKSCQGFLIILYVHAYGM